MGKPPYLKVTTWGVVVKRSNWSCIRSHGAKGRRIESFLFLLFVSQTRVEKRRLSREETKWTRNEERWRAREWRIKEEEPAGVFRTGHEKGIRFVSQTIKWLTPIKEEGIEKDAW